tara:strand:+ start:290 stop:619 length:330 start_codon:yes stop_codon:yes gene_type:complete
MVGSKTSKLREPEARILALRIAASFPNREATTSQIKELIPKYRELGDADLKPSKSRPSECMWQQIVGNVVSHDKASTSLFNKGLAVRLSSKKAIRVTDKGIEILKKHGY